MGNNFHGVQIFVGSLHPRKFYFALIFGTCTSRDQLAIFSDLHVE